MNLNAVASGIKVVLSESVYFRFLVERFSSYFRHNDIYRLLDIGYRVPNLQPKQQFSGTSCVAVKGLRPDAVSGNYILFRNESDINFLHRTEIRDRISLNLSAESGTTVKILVAINYSKEYTTEDST